MKISIIIPIYNSAAFLAKCLESVIQQNFDDFEALLVNDGSTDSSKVICEEFVAKDHRFKMYNQANQGVSIARNNGIKYAQGDWLVFLDSDDSLEAESLQLIMKQINGDEDFLVARAYLNNENSIIGERYAFRQSFLNRVFTGEELVLNHSYKHGSAYGCLFSRQFVLANNIIFPEGIKNGEDSIFTTQCHLFATKVKFVDVHFYNVMERVGSASRSWNIERVLHMQDNFDFLNDFLYSNTRLSDSQRVIVNYNLLGVVTKMFHGLYSCFSVKNYFAVRRIIKKKLKNKVDIGLYKRHRKKVRLLNTSIDLYACTILTNSLYNALKK